MARQSGRCAALGRHHCFMDPQQRLIYFMQRPSERAAVHAEFRAAVYGALRPAR